MNIHIPKWVIAAFVGAAPMLGIVFLILFSCTLLGVVQRCKISLSKSYANRKRATLNERFSIIDYNDDNQYSEKIFKSPSSLIIVSPFDEIPMKDIDAESSSKAYSEPKDDFSDSPKFRPNRSIDASINSSDYDNNSSSIFNDNYYEQDNLSLIETASQRKTIIKQQKSPETIIHV